jgi:peptidyl-prolyl cis-trans isomerase SurA
MAARAARRATTTLCLLALLLTALPTGAELVSKVVAVVNDAIITSLQLDAAVAAEQRGNPEQANLNAAQWQELRQKVLNRMVDEELLRQRIAELKLTVSNTEVEEAISDIQQQNNLTRAQLIEALESQGMEFDTYRRNMHDQILRFKLLGREVQDKVDVTHSEVLDYYNAHLDDYRRLPFLHLANLVFTLPTKADDGVVAASRSRAEEARRRLLQGDRVEAILITFKEVSGVQGGDMGKVREQDLGPQFAAAVSGLETGAVSKIVETPKGFYLFKIVERSSGTPRPLDEVEPEIEKKLLENKREERFSTWQSDLKKSAYIDIRL